MRKLRIMMLVHYTLVPPDDLEDYEDPRMEMYQTEFDVKDALIELGHEVRILGVFDDITPIRQTIDEWKPHIAFNLLEEFGGRVDWDFYVVGYLEMLGVPFTGCNPRGLVLARDKALSKKLLSYHHIQVPDFHVFTYGKTPKRLRKLRYPMIVKSLMEEGSYGISQASFVEKRDELLDRVALVHERTQGDAIAEQYIDGRELYVTVLGNKRLQVLPIRELVFNKVDESLPKMATYKVKWDYKYRERWGIQYQFARNLPDGMAERIERLCKRIYRILNLSGYARMDLRLTRDGKLFVLEANPNPGIAFGEDCAMSAEKAGMDYESFVQRIVSLGLRAHREKHV